MPDPEWKFHCALAFAGAFGVLLLVYVVFPAIWRQLP